MTDRTPAFRSVMRGYDPAQVEAHLAELSQALEAARREVGDRTVELSKTQSAHADLTTRLEQARRQVAALVEYIRARFAPDKTKWDNLEDDVRRLRTDVGRDTPDTVIQR